MSYVACCAHKEETEDPTELVQRDKWCPDVIIRTGVFCRYKTGS